jgi:hypothetical protein
MSHRQTRFERADEGSFPYWVCLIDEQCTGANYKKIQTFCREQGLTLSRFGHSVAWEKEWYQVFRFGTEEHAQRFMQEFGGQCIQASGAKANVGQPGIRGPTNRSLGNPTTSQINGRATDASGRRLQLAL